MLSLPVPLSGSADLDHAEMPRANTLSQRSAYIREHAAHRAQELAELPGIILEAGETYGIDPFLLARLIHVESTFDRRAVSSVGAIGVTQFLPATIRSYGMSVEQFRHSLHCQVTLAARYLADLTRRYGSQDLALLTYSGTLSPRAAAYVMRVRGIR
jgi:soluble lytic murein transglycosylase-like protein